MVSLEVALFLLTNAAFLFMSLVLLLVFFENKPAMHKDPPAGRRWPSITVVIPAFNEEAGIAKTIRSALELDYRGRKQVFVVDDGSTDDTVKVAKRFRGIAVFAKKHAGKGAGLNYALARCRTQLLAVLDADSFASRDALAKMVGYFRDASVGAVTPIVKVSEPSNIVQFLQHLEYLGMNYMRRTSSYLNSVFCTPGVLSVYRTGALKAIGGFDEHNLTEDLEIALRLQFHGWRIASSAGARTYSEAPAGILELLRQRLRWYTGALDNGRKYKHMLFNRKFGDLGAYAFPANFVAAGLLVFVGARVLWHYLVTAADQASIFLSYLSVGVLPSLSQVLSENADPLYFLSVEAVASIISLLLFFYTMWLSYNLSGEKLTFKQVPVFGVFLLVYSLIVGFAWLASMGREVLGVKSGW